MAKNFPIVYWCDLKGMGCSNNQDTRIKGIDQMRFLAGRHLIKAALTQNNIPPSEVKTDRHHRPYFPDASLDFNISHSGNLVLCVVSGKGKVGIDLEAISEINLDNFKSSMSDVQWQSVIDNSNPIHEFYRLWTIRESVVKADGRGLAIPFKHIKIEDNQIHAMGKRWFIHEIDLDGSYMAHLAWDYPINKIDLRKISLAGIINSVRSSQKT